MRAVVDAGGDLAGREFIIPSPLAVNCTMGAFDTRPSGRRRASGRPRTRTWCRCHPAPVFPFNPKSPRTKKVGHAKSLSMQQYTVHQPTVDNGLTLTVYKSQGDTCPLAVLTTTTT